ncbi:hypothetical protein WUBG_17713 [Wuchereria bancrofti]|uniref:Uncharacterized protein n=1 Tax=Wuchereria bancrofti TaxID=6293 RepID=J9DP14_WUCBA|nr:hypothetical protein WUBG_17713 [Wuchereria bancrofti]
MLPARSELSAETNISVATFDESKKSDAVSSNSLVYPIPLRPQSLLLPITAVNVPAVCGLYNPADAVLNTLAIMQFALGIL